HSLCFRRPAEPTRRRGPVRPHNRCGRIHAVVGHAAAFVDAGGEFIMSFIFDPVADPDGDSGVTGGTVMSHYIAEPCIGTKDTACVAVCPVDCIHPTKEEADFATAEMLYIDPDTCIDCGLCVDEC